jgi:hypothetical protein
MNLNDPAWLLILAGLGALLFAAQVVLNLWFGSRLFILTDNTATITALTAKLDSATLGRMDVIQAKIHQLESAIANRLDANIALLEKIIDHRDGPTVK